MLHYLGIYKWRLLPHGRLGPYVYGAHVMSTWETHPAWWQAGKVVRASGESAAPTNDADRQTPRGQRASRDRTTVQ
jgi:hypothetical protein